MVGFGRKWPQFVQNRAASCASSNCTMVPSPPLPLSPSRGFLLPRTREIAHLVGNVSL